MFDEHTLRAHIRFRLGNVVAEGFFANVKTIVVSPLHETRDALKLHYTFSVDASHLNQYLGDTFEIGGNGQERYRTAHARAVRLRAFVVQELRDRGFEVVDGQAGKKAAEPWA